MDAKELVKEVVEKTIVYSNNRINEPIKRAEKMSIMVYIVLTAFAHIPRIKEISDP